MAPSWSEHFPRARRNRRLILGVLASSLFAAGLAPALAEDPPQPDFFWPFGTVQVDGANIEPSQQTVIALVGGKACGDSTTFVATPGPGVPETDAGKTVYGVNVLANGTNSGQRLGCGVPGEPVMLYFAGSHRIAAQQPTFLTGGLRVDVDLGPELIFRLPLPLLAADGVD